MYGEIRKRLKYIKEQPRPYIGSGIYIKDVTYLLRLVKGWEILAWLTLILFTLSALRGIGRADTFTYSIEANRIYTTGKLNNGGSALGEDKDNYLAWGVTGKIYYEGLSINLQPFLVLSYNNSHYTFKTEKAYVRLDPFEVTAGVGVKSNLPFDTSIETSIRGAYYNGNLQVFDTIQGSHQVNNEPWENEVETALVDLTLRKVFNTDSKIKWFLSLSGQYYFKEEEYNWCVVAGVDKIKYLGGIGILW